MNPTASFLLVLIFATACSSPPSSAVSQAERAVSEDDYDRIKSLLGDWYLVGGERLGKVVEPNLEEPFLTYAITSAGHSVVEKLFVDQPSEMTSVYYLDKGRLKMDHYCSLGNQPKMVAVAGAENEIAFQVVEVGNLEDKDALHISSHSLEFNGTGEMTVYWGATERQKPTGGSMYKVKKLE
jgi:hypothetical protein